MAHFVEKAMHDMVPELDDLRRKKIFDDEEIRHIVKERRSFEYGLQKRPAKQQDFLSYVRYEVALECLRSRRRKALKWNKKTLSDFSGVRRIQKVLARGTTQFRGDKRMWYQAIDFTLRCGSTKALSRTLLRALQYHPREVHLWLLAADRELKLGHMKAARTLLTRALRFLPTSSKLWAEFIRLEVQVAVHRREFEGIDQNKKDGAAAEDQAASKPAADKWALPRLLLRRAMAKLHDQPGGKTHAFLALVRPVLLSAQDTNDGVEEEDKGLQDFGDSFRATLKESRITAASLEGCETATVVGSWQLWWSHERAMDTPWSEIVREVAAAAGVPAGVVGILATELAGHSVMGDEVDGQDDNKTSPSLAALVQLAASECASGVADAAASVLRALEKTTEASSCEPQVGKEEAAKAARVLLEQAAVASPNCGRLAMQSWGGPSCGQAAPEMRANSWCTEDAAVRVLLDPVANSKPGEAERERVLESVLRSLTSSEEVAPVVAAFLANVAAGFDAAAIRGACGEARKAAAKVWDVPGRHAAALAATLDAELRCLGALEPAELPAQVKALGRHFEDLLAALQTGSQCQEDWLLRFMGFVKTAATWTGGAPVPGLPTGMDLHWRAMRSVTDQSRYLERAQSLVQGL